MKLPSSSTLSLSYLPGQTFALALCILALIAAASEAAARLWLDGSSVPVAIGSTNTTFDRNIGLLDELLEREGHVDCILLGSSVVLNGFDPALVSETYAQQTGDPLACYNFGIPALTAKGAGLLAELLVERYHPRLLIYGLTLRAVAEGAFQSDRIYWYITETPWVQYKRGAFTLTGWLADHSSAFQHFLAYRNWMKHEFGNWLAEHKNASRTGYTPLYSTPIIDPAAVNGPAYFTTFRYAPQDLAGLDQILRLHGQGVTQVLLVELPLPLFFRELFDGGAAGYQMRLDELAARAAEYGVPLWQTSTLDLVPENGWAADIQHVNDNGARALSRWLGERLANWAW